MGRLRRNNLLGFSAILAIWFTTVSGCGSLNWDIQTIDSVGEATHSEVDPDRSQQIASKLPLAIDRRPVRVISLWNSNRNDPVGRDPWWADDEKGVENLEGLLDGYHSLGYRRIMLSLPAGHPRGQHLMSSSQWLTMTPERREQLKEMLPRWKLDHPEAEIYVYAGFNVADPTSLFMPEPIAVPDLDRDWQWFQDNWQGWIEDCDIDGIGFDYAGLSPNRAVFIEVARALSIAGVKCIGEAIPTTWAPNGHVLADEVLMTPHFALDQYIYGRDLQGRWRFDPRRTECGVGLRNSMRVAGSPNRVPVTEKMIRDWVRRGLIPYCYAKKWDELVMELERDRLATDPDPRGE